MIETRVQPFATLLAFRKMLQQQSASEPVAIALFGSEANQARDLLRLGEIALRCLGKVLAFERDDTLIALLGNGLVERDREIALAKELLQRGPFRSARDAFRVMSDIAAQLAALIIADQHVDDSAIGLR